MDLTRTYTKKGSTTTVSAKTLEGGRVEITQQRWAPSGRRLVHNQSQWSLQAVGTIFSGRCDDLEKLGWVRQEVSG